MTLQDFESEIEKLERCLPDERSEPFESIEHECCVRLRELSASIRQVCWSEPFRAWAHELHTRADASASKLGEQAGLLPHGRLPRWAACYSTASGWSPAID